VAPWLYATVDGVGSARALARLCREHVAYRRLCGGVSVNHHTLSDFRVAHVDWLDGVLTASVARLMHQGLVTLERVAQDGMRTLEEREAADASRPGDGTSGDDDGDAGEDDERDQRRARRASTTDPEARMMKMAQKTKRGGGWRPAVNVQYAADVASGIVVGVDLTKGGNDQPNLETMVDQIAARYANAPGVWLADGGFVSLDAVKDLDALGMALYAPPPKSRGGRRSGPRRGDALPVAAWRERMASEAGQAIYKERAATSEWKDAQARGRGLQQMPVRGRAEAKAVALWHAIAHNLPRRLAPPAARPA